MVIPRKGPWGLWPSLGDLLACQIRNGERVCQSGNENKVRTGRTLRPKSSGFLTVLLLLLKLYIFNKTKI